MPVRVSPETNPAASDDLEENLFASLTLNPDSLSVPVISGSNHFEGQTESLRVSNDLADVVQGYVDEVSLWREEEGCVGRHCCLCSFGESERGVFLDFDFSFTTGSSRRLAGLHLLLAERANCRGDDQTCLGWD
jgi:hypothetical protein